MMTSSQSNPPQLHAKNLGLELAFLLIKAPATVVMPTTIVASRQLFTFLLFQLALSSRGAEVYLATSKLLSSG